MTNNFKVVGETFSNIRKELSNKDENISIL